MNANPEQEAARLLLATSGCNRVPKNNRTVLKLTYGQTIRRYTDFEEMKADEYRYWQSRPAHEHVKAVSEFTREHYALKDGAADVPRLQRTLGRFERASR